MLHPDRCEIAKELYWGEGRRPKPEDAFALDLAARLAGEANVLLDVGAYTGVFTLACAAVNTALRVHAFEIVPSVADTLERNVARNGLADRVTVHREGIGEPGRVMIVPVGEGGSALPSFYSSRLHFEEGVPVGFRSLDSLATLLPLKPRVVMKIDVEGTENAIFQHGQKFLERFRPDIICEVLDGVANGSELEALLSPFRLQFYLVREDDLLVREHVLPHPRFRDWLFTPLQPANLAARGIATTTGSE
jgi:FkbM family methyltransferase